MGTYIHAYSHLIHLFITIYFQTTCEGGAEVSLTQDNQSKVPISKEDIEKLYEMAKTLKYGSITLVFQDGKLIQIEKNEKVRVK